LQEALKWWRNGEFEKVKKYCIEDVRITKDIYDFAMKNGFLNYKEGKEMKQIKLDTSNWEKIEKMVGTSSLF
jgi:DEAD/DEAH box helicase domain-containing protein